MCCNIVVNTPHAACPACTACRSSCRRRCRRWGLCALASTLLLLRTPFLSLSAGEPQLFPGRLNKSEWDCDSTLPCSCSCPVRSAAAAGGRSLKQQHLGQTTCLLLRAGSAVQAASHGWLPHVARTSGCDYSSAAGRSSSALAWSAAGTACLPRFSFLRCATVAAPEDGMHGLCLVPVVLSLPLNPVGVGTPRLVAGRTVLACLLAPRQARTGVGGCPQLVAGRAESLRTAEPGWSRAELGVQGTRAACMPGSPVCRMSTCSMLLA